MDTSIYAVSLGCVGPKSHTPTRRRRRRRSSYDVVEAEARGLRAQGREHGGRDIDGDHLTAQRRGREGKDAAACSEIDENAAFVQAQAGSRASRSGHVERDCRRSRPVLHVPQGSIARHPANACGGARPCLSVCLILDFPKTLVARNPARVRRSARSSLGSTRALCDRRSPRTRGPNARPRRARPRLK
jgi:hypothetical protein